MSDDVGGLDLMAYHGRSMQMSKHLNNRSCTLSRPTATYQQLGIGESFGKYWVAVRIPHLEHNHATVQRDPLR